MHFGRTDRSIPFEDVATFRDRQPDVEIRAYDAGHAFNRDDDGAFQPEAANLAWSRTIDFLAKHLGGAALGSGLAGNTRDQVPESP